MSTINLAKQFKRQGLDPHTLHEALVVDNNDPRKLGRIRARVKGVFDDIQDTQLPWAIPRHAHVDGANNKGQDGKDQLNRSGTFYVPKKGSKVLLQFPEGDAHTVYWTGYTVDETTNLPEYRDKNYPDRAVLKFQNGMYIIIDTKTNEIFINNPGDIDVTILGDVNQYIVGNQQLVVTDTKSYIPGYLLNAPETVLNQLSPKPAKEIPFKGLLSKSRAGNQHTHIKGDHTMFIEGNQKVEILGNSTWLIHGNYTDHINGWSKQETDLNSDILVHKNLSMSVDQAIKYNSGTGITGTAGRNMTLRGVKININ